jgi:hypothetical protein
VLVLDGAFEYRKAGTGGYAQLRIRKLLISVHLSPLSRHQETESQLPVCNSEKKSFNASSPSHAERV